MYEVDAHQSNHFTDIALKRPNSVLLLATVPEGVAFRSVFTGAIAECICKSDGMTDIYDMFLSASRKSQQVLSDDDKIQIPKFESTLSKKLYLPPFGEY